MGDEGEFWRDVKAGMKDYLDHLAPYREEELKQFVERQGDRLTVTPRDQGSCLRLTMDGVHVDYWPRRQYWHDITHQQRGKGFKGVVRIFAAARAAQAKETADG